MDDVVVLVEGVVSLKVSKGLGEGELAIVQELDALIKRAVSRVEQSTLGDDLELIGVLLKTLSKLSLGV